jgi:glucose/arabinose dehydrogenase
MGTRRSILPLAAMTVVAVLASVGVLVAVPISSAQSAVTLPPGFAQTKVVGGLTKPIDMEFAPDGRLFIASKGGQVRIAKRDGTVATFLDISAKVTTFGERGLQALTFDPNFATNHFVYLNYTRKASATDPAHNRIVRVTADGNKAVAGSERLIFRLSKQVEETWHQGGAIDFGQDGKLYVAAGDNHTPSNAQSLSNLHGKMLRINKDGTIPTNNPFYTRASGNNRAIWALGLRNPFKFAVTPGTSSGESIIYINDVGQGTWEEINLGDSGANYGWPAYEGPDVYQGPESDAEYTPPIHAYEHGSGTDTTGCAITGGTFYNPKTVQFPSEYKGLYFFADICNGWIRVLDNPATGTTSEFATGLSPETGILSGVVDLEVRESGELYYLKKSGDKSSVHKIRYTGN